MKKFTLLLLPLALIACGEPSTDTAKESTTNTETTEPSKEPETPKVNKPTKPSSEDFDSLQLAYIQLKQGTVDCRSKIVGNYSYSACRYVSLNGNSAWQVWYYDTQKDPQKRYYALNGTARSTYETHLQSNAVLGDYEAGFGLPMPDDMKLDEVIGAFGE